jgi:alkylhydroperoxidase family enzyme
MAWIRTVPPEEADGPLAKQYEAAVARAGRVYQIVQSMSIAPGILDASMKHFGQIAHAREGLTRSNRELVAVVVSVVNECHY